MNISNKYTIVQCISEGSFGKIYKGQHIRTKEYVAIKVEPNDSETKTLKNETKIYQYLGKIIGFPRVKWFGIDDTNNYMVIDLLGSSLSSLVKKYYALSLKSVLRLGIQMIQRIQSLHERYLIHRDIKPDNFLIGVCQDTQDILHLIDFGFCKRYTYGMKHIECKHISNIIGTPNFVSINVHNGCEPSRRDDLESILYVMLFCFLGTLHWIHPNDIVLSNNKIMEGKKELLFITDIPDFFKEMLCYVRGLLFEQQPNYLFLISILEEELSKINNDIPFEWM